jgi:hypothetical protein
VSMNSDTIQILDGLVARVRAEYREMPGLSLTTWQASRLLGIHHSVCERLLHRLVTDGVLYCTPGGTYVAGPLTRAERADANGGEGARRFS